MRLWGALLALPLVGLVLLLARPPLDAHWEHHPSHFWLVLSTAILSVGLALLTGEVARRREDARLVLVSLAFLASAGFLALHALATPGVLLEHKNAGFVIATPVGLFAGAVFSAASAVDLRPAAAAVVLRAARPLRAGVVLLIAAWAAVSLASIPPLDAVPPERAEGPLLALAANGLALYGFAAWGYLRVFRRGRTTLLVGVVTAFALLAEAMIAVAVGRNWHASWWEWHLLMTAAFACVAGSAYIEYRRHGSATGAFSALLLDHSLERLDRRYHDALARLVTALDRGEALGPVLAGLQGRARMTEEEVHLLERAAVELHRLDQLFRPYLSPQLAAGLRERPQLAELGGEEREVSVIFADLQGFTAFAEHARPIETMEMLNDYWAGAVPIVVEEYGGLIERFAGDAIMVVFNAPDEQPDHALRAAGAALALQQETSRIGAGRPGWPRFRAGVNTGRAVVGNVGTPEHHSFAAIGDATNVAARLQYAAAPGEVVIGAATAAALGPRAVVERVGRVRVRGRKEPVEAFVLSDLYDASSQTPLAATRWGGQEGSGPHRAFG